MRIRNNGPARRSYNSYRTNSGSLRKNLEKLSSGYKINRSADDAAGLAVSEKMRASITGLDGAHRNAKHGIGLIQVTEGALQEYQEIVNRMLELSVKSANATYDDDVDRDQLQKEMTRLAQELNRIADSANFNGIYTLREGFAPGEEDTAPLEIGDVTAELAGGDVVEDIEEAQLLDARLEEENAQSGEVQFSLLWDTRQDLDLHCYTPNNREIYYGNRRADGGELDVDAQASVVMECTQKNALDAIDKLKSAVNKVSDVRGTYGTLQNRLEHTMNYLGNAHENTQSAESLIRDADMADEMMKYTKNSILTQSAQSMMAQANMLPQGVLQLMQ